MEVSQVTIHVHQHSTQQMTGVLEHACAKYEVYEAMRRTI